MNRRRSTQSAIRRTAGLTAAALTALGGAAAALPVQAAPATRAAAAAEVTAANRPATPAGDRVVPGAYVVVLKESTPVTGRHVPSAVRARRSAALLRVAAAAGARPTATTTAAVPSFTAQLSRTQATKLAADPNVLAVRPVRVRKVAVYGTPGYLGLTGTGPGSWTSFGGMQGAGRGVVIGFVDSGVWPEAPTFTQGVPALAASATTTVGTAYRTSATGTAMRKADGGTFTGDCSGATAGATTQQWTPTLCNQAIVSARSFPPSAGWVNPGPTDPHGREFASPRDGLGHGTHTAATAVGRSVPVSYQGHDLGISTGIAPGATAAIYKACWTTRYDSDGDGTWDNYCSDDSLVSAIDKAVADNVDIISMSISGTTTDPLDPVDLALLGAARAGILPVAAAGNDGPAAGTANHPNPWTLTVGAATWQSPIAVGDYSGRGPANSYNGLVLKPDLVAPGTNVLAAVPPAMGRPVTEPTVELMSGTSMATPHVSALAADLLSRRPTLSPMMVRSALSTSATPLPGVASLDQGSGYVGARGMVSGDLLMDATPADYAAVLSWTTGSGGKNPLDLNTPSISFGDIRKRHTTTRTFVAQRAGAWTVRADLPGYVVTMSPHRGVARRAGQKITVAIDLRRTTAAYGAFAQGWLRLDGGRGTTTLPLVARTS